MPLVYRAVLQDSDGSITNAVEPLFLEWLRTKHLVEEDFRLAPGLSSPLTGGSTPAWLQHQHVKQPRQKDDGLHRLRLVEELPEGRWTTTVLWRRQTPHQEALELHLPTADEQLSLVQPVSRERAGAWVWLDLEHEPLGGRTPVRPGSPRFIRDLMAAGEAFDGKLPLTSEALTVRHGHIAELVRYITDPERHIPVVVFAYDGKRAYDQETLASRLARDLAGVAAVFVLADARTTQALATALPEELGVFAGAVRTYLPGAGGEGDSPNRHRVLGRVSLGALGQRAFPALKDQVLRLSTRRPGPVDSMLLRRLTTAPSTGESPPTTVEPTPRGDSLLQWLTGQIRRIREATGRHGLGEPLGDVAQGTSALTAEIDELLQPERLQGRTSEPDPSVDDARLRDLEGKLAAAQQERALLESLFSEASSEAAEATIALGDLQDDRDYLELELAEELRESERLRRRARWLSAQLASTGQSPVDNEPVVEVPAAVAEVVELARQTLAHVVIGPTDADAAELDVHSGASLYAAKTWEALLALDAFAAARQAGHFSGNFRAWCLTPADGSPAISAQAVAMTESQTVDTNPGLRSKRIFAVPGEVNEERTQYMPAHVKLVKRGEAAPRLHFHDDSAGKTGVIHVGYIGPHLPTARFS